MKRILWFVILLSFSGLFADNSFFIRLDKVNTLQSTLDLIVESGVLNVGKNDGGNSTWLVRVNDATIGLDESNQQVSLTLDSRAYGAVTISGINVTFSSTVDLEFTVSGTPDLVWDSQTGQMNLVISNIDVDISDLSAWNAHFENFTNASINMTQAWQNLNIISLGEFYPNLDPEYFSHTAIEVTNNALLIKAILNEPVKVAAQSVSSSTSYLNCQLDLVNQDTPELTYGNIKSPTYKKAKLGDTYTAHTQSIEINGITHNTWTNDLDHKLNSDQFVMNQDYPDDGLIAKYKPKNSVEIADITPDLQLRDPWHISNPNADPEDWDQPNSFQPVSGSYDVFLNQEYDPNNPDLPIYSLKAPRYYADTEYIYELDEWQAFDASNNQVSVANSAFINVLSKTSPESNVVFKQAGV